MSTGMEDGRPSLPAIAGGLPPFAPGAGVAVLCRLAQQIASAAFDVPEAEIRRPNRSVAPSCEARHAAMYLAHVSFQLSLTAIAREFGRDRTSVGHAIRRIEDRRDEPAFETKLERLERLAETCRALTRAQTGDEA